MSENEEQGENLNNEIFPLPNRVKWDSIHQIFYQGENYYRVVDVIEALEVAEDAANYWSLMERAFEDRRLSASSSGAHAV